MQSIQGSSNLNCMPSRAMVGNEGRIFFVSLQNVARWPTPVFYKQIKIHGYIGGVGICNGNSSQGWESTHLIPWE